MKSKVSPYVPFPSVVERSTRISEKERLLKVVLPSPVEFSPGQFLMAGLPGYGEAPFSITSAPGKVSELELCIRAAGNLTMAIHRLKPGERLWTRGPFGRGFPLDAMKGKNILFVAGGIGIVPMRSLVKGVLQRRGLFKKLTLLYGAKSPMDMLFLGDISDWKGLGLEAELTVDYGMPGWKGHVGVVTTLIPRLRLDAAETVSAVIGPPVMYRFVVKSLLDRLIQKSHIFLSLERRMKCGLGMCGHCQINSFYTCQEGPVFSLEELKTQPDAF